MIDREEARYLAEKFISTQVSEGVEFVILDDCTIEKEYGWVFFYQSKRFIESRQFSDMLAGNAPVLVLNADGSIYQFGTALPVDMYLEEYEREHPAGS